MIIILIQILLVLSVIPAWYDSRGLAYLNMAHYVIQFNYWIQDYSTNY